MSDSLATALNMVIDYGSAVVALFGLAVAFASVIRTRQILHSDPANRTPTAGG